MKSHLSITIDDYYAKAVKRFSRQENRSISNFIEHILAQFFRQHGASEKIVTSPSKTNGSISREEIYDRSHR